MSSFCHGPIRGLGGWDECLADKRDKVGMDAVPWRNSDVSQVEKYLMWLKTSKNYIKAPSDSYEVITFSLTTATSSHLAMCLFLSWLIHIRNFKVIQGLNILFVATEVSAFLQVIAYLTLFLPGEGANLPYTLKTH